MITRCALFGMVLAAPAVSIASSSSYAAERPLKHLSEAEIAQFEEVLPEKATVNHRIPIPYTAPKGVTHAVVSLSAVVNAPQNFPTVFVDQEVECVEVDK